MNAAEQTRQLQERVREKRRRIKLAEKEARSKMDKEGRQEALKYLPKAMKGWVSKINEKVEKDPDSQELSILIATVDRGAALESYFSTLINEGKKLLEEEGYRVKIDSEDTTDPNSEATIHVTNYFLEVHW